MSQGTEMELGSACPCCLSFLLVAVTLTLTWLPTLSVAENMRCEVIKWPAIEQHVEESGRDVICGTRTAFSGTD